MIIRPCTEGDLPALSSLARTTYTETFGHSFTDDELETQLRTTRSEEYFRTALQTDTILVAVDDARLIGYVQITNMTLTVENAACDIHPDDQAIHAIYVLKDQQGKGIGKALMQAAFEHPRITNARSLFIDVWDENIRAVNFYTSIGFKNAGTTPVIVDGKHVGDDLVLWLQINERA